MPMEALMYDHIYLAHHGIKGQKWGVRRFRNKDGSLTPEGYRHYYGDNPNARMTRFGVVDATTGRMLYTPPRKNSNKETYPNNKNEKGMPQKRTLTDKQKKALIVAGAAAVGVGLAAYGMHRYHDVLDDRVMKALAVEGKAIFDDPSNNHFMFGRYTKNHNLVQTKQTALRERVLAYDRSRNPHRDPFKNVADIITKQDYLKEHKLARDLSRGRTSIYSPSPKGGTNYQFYLYNIGENPGHNPNFVPYEFDPKITVRDVIRGVKKKR